MEIVRLTRTFGRQALRILATALLIGAAAAHGADEAASSPDIARLAAFGRIVDAIKGRYVDPVNEEKLYAAAIHSILTSLDPHSMFLDADEYRLLQQQTVGRFGGIGIEVRKAGRFIEIVRVRPGTPAHDGGIRAGDLIAKIDGVDVAGMTLDQAVERARGRPDTPVTVTIIRGGDSLPRVVSLVRATIHPPSVQADFLDSAYAYIRIRQFTRRTPVETASSLGNIVATRGALVTGLVLDLRDNPGGLMTAAVDVAGLFLPSNTLVVTTQGASRQANMTLYAPRDPDASDDAYDHAASLAALRSIPMVVLVNGGSASAAEILTGALQDHKRATVVGTQTFGKGSVQVVIPLGDGTALKLTTARYLTPAGRAIDGKGIRPDVIVDGTIRSADASAVPATDPAQIHDVVDRTHTSAGVEATPIDNSSLPKSGVDTADPQLQRAIEILSHASLRS